jgi:hypothetical protein
MAVESGPPTRRGRHRFAAVASQTVGGQQPEADRTHVRLAWGCGRVPAVVADDADLAVRDVLADEAPRAGHRGAHRGAATAIVLGARANPRIENYGYRRARE